VVQQVWVACPHVIEWVWQRGACRVHEDEQVELEHHEAQVRYEGGESLSKAGIREMADGVNVVIDQCYITVGTFTQRGLLLATLANDTEVLTVL
jgi:hypothetical protein